MRWKREMAEQDSAFRCELIGDEISDIDVLENNLKNKQQIYVGKPASFPIDNLRKLDLTLY